MDSPAPADSWGVAHIAHSAEIEVRAPAEAAFAVVAGDILGVEGDDLCRPIDDGPLRVGFRWLQTVVHDSSMCRAGWIVTELREPWVLEQAMEHVCAEPRRELQGGERWQFEERGGSTLVTLRSWYRRTGPRAWLGRLVTSRHDPTGISLGQRLAYVQFRAEHGSPRPA
jgi:hypothetical protein